MWEKLWGIQVIVELESSECEMRFQFWIEIQPGKISRRKLLKMVSNKLTEPQVPRKCLMHYEISVPHLT